MKYKDFIKPSEGFQYSINLQYDLGNNTKVAGYIPTYNTTEILKSYLKVAYDGQGDKTTVVVGPYGKGKSHLFLVLLTLLENKEENKESIYKLIDKMWKIDAGVAQLCKTIIDDNIKLLPIIINSNYADLQQSFLIALDKALKNNNLTDIMPNTFFNSVIDLITKWKLEFKDTIKNFKLELKDLGYTFAELEKGIKGYDIKAYEVFKKVYLRISSGIEYNPLINSDIVKLYDETNFLLCDKYGYKGMFIVFDEFSKFMELGVSNNTIKDIKILQDFAELSGRTDSKQQLHLACITHKTINEYVSKLPREAINAWRGIEGRFKELYLTSSSKQNYSLIANAIIKDETNLKVFLKDSEFYSYISNSYELFKEVYSSEKDFKREIGEECFPLNPITTFALPKISEKVAQNERTLFTFLCKNEKCTLTDFISKNDGKLELLNLDVVFDYFENLFKKEVFNDEVHDIWIKADAAIRKCEVIEEKKILKALAIIYIINELDDLKPTKEILMLALNYDENKVNNLLTSMIKNNLLYLKRSNEYINFVPLTKTNIKDKIELIKNTKIRNVNISKELENILNLGFILPKRYNDQYKMIRYFRRTYMTLSQLEAFEDSSSIFEYFKSDGIIADLIYFNDEDKKRALDKVIELNNGRLILCIPNRPFNKVETLMDYMSVQVLKEDKEFLSNEPLLEQLLDIIEEDLVDDLNKYIEKYFIPENRSSKYFIYGKQHNIFKKSDLNKEVSEICLMYFNKTPKINNEMINKNSVTTVISKARQKVVKYIIDSYNDSTIETLMGHGPEVTIYRTTITNLGLEENVVSKDQNLNDVLQIIRNFIVSCEKSKKSLAELYEVLLGENISIRKGIIPIYIAYIFREFKDELILYFGSRGNKEVDFNEETLENINFNSKDYYVKIEKGTKEKDDFIKSLIDLFEKYINKKTLKTNKFTGIVNAMQSYVQSMSQYTRTHNKSIDGKDLDEGIIKFRSELLKFDLNCRDFLFNKLPKFLRNDNYYECFNTIRTVKDYLDKTIEDLIIFLIKETNIIVNSFYKGSLTQNLRSWYLELDDNKRNHLYDVTTNKILNFIDNLDNNNERYVINKLANIVTGLNIEDWQENTIELYFKDLEKSIDVVNNLPIDIDNDEENIFKLEINESKGKVEKNFEKQDISEIGNNLLNELEDLLDEYGDSIEANEKRNILVKLLKKYM